MTIHADLEQAARIHDAHAAYREALRRYEQAPHGCRLRALERLRAAKNALLAAEVGNA